MVMLVQLFFAFLLLCISAGPVHGQENSSRSILSIEEGFPKHDKPVSKSNGAIPIEPLNSALAARTAPAKLAHSGKTPKPIIDKEANLELVRDRYPSGKPHFERQVALDSDGNFVNHGHYRELSENGDLLVSGNYQYGQRVGVWSRFLTGSESQLLKNYPFAKFRAPFSSSVEFVADRMHGVWVITDRDKHIACQIELQHGQRHGTTTFFHPNGQVYLQSTYSYGVLDGANIEKNQEGKVVREELFSGGRKQAVETEHHANKSVKSVMRYLTPTLQVAQPDNWLTTSLASYSTTGEKVLHGEFVTYHENGQVATKGSYMQGQLHGAFENWYRNGDLASSGTYDHGQQDGDWVWRHANGMKRAVARYNKGKVQGESRAWDEKGKAVSFRPKDHSNSL